MQLGVTGKNQTGLAMAVGVTPLGPLGLAVRGKNIEVPEGQLASAKLTKDTEFTVREEHVGVVQRGDRVGAEMFADTVGIGSYRIDLHPSTGLRTYVDISSWPFQIPLGALIPIRVENLLPACKNLGVTHITNGCYRLHPVEWNIGEAAGA